MNVLYKIMLNVFKSCCICQYLMKLVTHTLITFYTTLSIFSLSITSTQMFACENPVAIINWDDKKATRVASRTQTIPRDDTVVRPNI